MSYGTRLFLLTKFMWRNPPKPKSTRLSLLSLILPLEIPRYFQQKLRNNTLSESISAQSFKTCESQSIAAFPASAPAAWQAAKPERHDGHGLSSVTRRSPAKVRLVRARQRQHPATRWARSSSGSSPSSNPNICAQGSGRSRERERGMHIAVRRGSVSSARRGAVNRVCRARELEEPLSRRRRVAALPRLWTCGVRARARVCVAARLGASSPRSPRAGWPRAWCRPAAPDDDEASRCRRCWSPEKTGWPPPAAQLLLVVLLLLLRGAPENGRSSGRAEAGPPAAGLIQQHREPLPAERLHGRPALPHLQEVPQLPARLRALRPLLPGLCASWYLIVIVFFFSPPRPRPLAPPTLCLSALCARLCACFYACPVCGWGLSFLHAAQLSFSPGTCIIRAAGVIGVFIAGLSPERESLALLCNNIPAPRARLSTYNMLDHTMLGLLENSWWWC